MRGKAPGAHRATMTATMVVLTAATAAGPIETEAATPRTSGAPVSTAAAAAGPTHAISPPGESWLDPEILRLSTGEGLITWQDGVSRDIWVARLDPHTGLPDLASRWRMGTEAAPLTSTYNGPEFGVDARGWSVYYSQGATGTQAARGWLEGGKPAHEVLTRGSEHFTPLATKHEGASSTRLLLLRRPPSWGTAGWLDVASPDDGHDIAFLAARTDGDLRWIDGTFAYVANFHPAHPGQLAVVDTATGEVTRVSEETGRISDPYGWKAPEAAGSLFVLGVLDDTELVVWSRVGDVWVPYRRWRPPAGAPPFIGSPEPFVANGRSYVSLSLATSADVRPGLTDQQIWVIGVAPDNPFETRCDDGRPAPVTRVDPEVFVGARQAFVYYYDLSAAASVAYRCALDIGGAGPSLRTILASETDPAIDDILGAHLVAIGPQAARNGRLLVFYPGTRATPDRYSLFLARAAELGYHAISLAYDNRQSVNFDLCPGQPDDCYEDVRLEVLLGIESGHSPPDVDPDNAAFHRLSRLLSYLHARFPSEGWDAYLQAGKPRWERIVVAGHSQGGGHAAMTARLHETAGALLFSATEPKAWTSTSFATPADRFFALAHAKEPIFAGIVRSWANIGIPGLPTGVEATPPPFLGSHRLTTATEECLGDPESDAYYHNCPVVDDFIALTPDGTPPLLEVWDTMLEARAPRRTVVPIVLDVASGTARYTTELSLANPGASDATVELRYTASLGDKLGSGTVSESVPAGGQVRFADALSALRARGLAIPEDGPQGGVLVVETLGAGVIATARTTTGVAAPEGRAGVAYVGLGESERRTGAATVFGLRSTATDRSNLAILSTSDEPVVVRVTAFDGDTGATAVLEEAMTLPAYGWLQIDGVLDRAGFGNGWVTVERTSSTGSFSAYGVVNDNVTNDGSFVPPVSASEAAQGTITLPVLVEAGAFQSELVVANRGSASARLVLGYVESLSPSGGTGGEVVLDVPAGRQLILPDALEALRSRGLAIGAKGTGTFAGALRASVSGVAAGEVFLGARTGSKAPSGGQFGVFTPGVSSGQTASTEACVYGLAADSLNRTNVAVLHAGGADSGPVTVSLQVHDGSSGGAAAGEALELTLSPGQWAQPPGFFEAAGVTNGYVRITRLFGTAPWVAYGVVNDGGKAGERTGDGAYVPAVAPAEPAGAAAAWRAHRPR